MESLIAKEGRQERAALAGERVGMPRKASSHRDDPYS